MIGLFSMKQQLENEKESGRKIKKRTTGAQLRIQKDINDLELPKTCKTKFADPDDLLNFEVKISPDEGFYRSGKYKFSFKSTNSVTKLETNYSQLNKHSSQQTNSS